MNNHIPDKVVVIRDEKRYEIIIHQRTGLKAIRCKKCEFISWNGNDVKKRYCGKCKEFLGEPNEDTQNT